MKKLKSLKVINDIKIDSACSMRWDDMKGGDKDRYCEKCKHSVSNISALTKRQSLKLIKNAGSQRICVRYLQNPDGSIKYKTGRAAIFFSSLLALIGMSTGHAEDKDTTKHPQPPYIDLAGGITAPIEHATPTPAPEPTFIMGKISIEKKD